VHDALGVRGLHDLGDDVVLGLARERCASARGRRDGATVGRILGLTHLHVLKAVLLTDAAEHVLLAALLHFACQQKLVEDEVGLLEVEDDVELAHVAVVFVHLLDVAVDDFESDQLVVRGVAAGDEEERGIAAINNLGVCGPVSAEHGAVAADDQPLYSRKLHMRVRRARTSWETSLTILALSLGARVVNHLARRYRASVRDREFRVRHQPLCPAARAG
jgi:hypothetical protein